MQIDIVNGNNEKVGALELKDELFGGRVKAGLIWEAVVQENASERRGTHATKNRAACQRQRQEAVAAEGHRPRARRRDPQPALAQGRNRVRPDAAHYAYDLPKKVRRGALAAALAQKLSDGAVIVVDRLEASDGKTKTTAQLLKRLGATGKTLVIDVTPEDGLRGVGAQYRRREAGGEQPRHRPRRDRHDRVVATKDALEKLQEALA